MTTEYLQSLEVLPTEQHKQNPPVTGTATVFLARTTGTTQNLASGWIYGIPDNPNQIPDDFYLSVGFRYGRGGGSQLPETRGWYRSEEDYELRFQSTLSNYRTTRKYGGAFIVLPSALWGADGGQEPDAEYPGDGGDWGSWDRMIGRFIGDAKAHDMIEGLVFDIWNEPDLKFFWNKGREQWLEMWERTYKVLRAELPTVKISGPCFSSLPTASSPWWTAFLSHIARTHTIPDEWSWHMEGGHGSLTTSLPTFYQLLAAHNLPIPSPKAININEYAIWAEQVPSGAVWFISQLERHDCYGLRGNWAMAGALHDLLAGLVSKPGAGTKAYDMNAGGYYPTAEYHVYKYYATDMKGERLVTRPTNEVDGEVFATRGDDEKIRVLAGTRNAVGQWNVVVEEGGFEDGEEINVRVLLFESNENHFEACARPREVEVRKVKWQNGKATLEIQQDRPGVAWAFEFEGKA